MHGTQLRERDRLARKAAWAVHQSGSVTAIARATNVHKSQPSRWRNGAQTGPAFNALVFIHALARGENTTAFPLICELKVEHMRGLMEGRSDQWLIRRFHELRDELEPQADASAKVASRGDCRVTYRRALLHEAATQMELAAVDEELERRNIDPRLYTKEGVRRIRPVRA